MRSPIYKYCNKYLKEETIGGYYGDIEMSGAAARTGVVK